MNQQNSIPINQPVDAQLQTPGEIMHQRVMGASPEDVQAAVAERLQELQAIPTPEDLRGKDALHRQRAETVDIAQAVKSWSHTAKSQQDRGLPAMSFTEYVQENVELGDEADSTLTAASWIEGAGQNNYYSTIRKYLEQKDAAPQSEQHPIGQPTQPEAPESASQTWESQHREHEIVNARQNVERARTIDTIIQIAKGKTQFTTDIAGGFKSIGDVPKNADPKGLLTSIENNYQLGRNGVLGDIERHQDDWHEQPNEVVAFTPVIERDTRTVQHPTTQKGRFGFGKTESSYTTEEDVPGSEHPKLIRNPLTGRDEPAVVFNYRFRLTDRTLMQNVVTYQEFRGGRPGQYIEVGMELPKSAAELIKSQLGEDPTIVRQLAEKAFFTNNDGNPAITEQNWLRGEEPYNHPIKPSYDTLPSDWKIHMADAMAETGHVTAKSYTVSKLPVQR